MKTWPAVALAFSFTIAIAAAVLSGCSAIPKAQALTTGGQGPQGPPGQNGISFIWKGPWSASTTYAANDVVSWAGSSWIALDAIVPGQGSPDQNLGHWSLMASVGSVGPAGAGFTFAGAFLSTAVYTANAIVSWGGSTWISIRKNTGDANPAANPSDWQLFVQEGSNGAAGSAATVAIGSTVTSAPGTMATVNNIGSANAAVLNFTIPAGAVGGVGPAGSQGLSGAAGQAATVAVGSTLTSAPGTTASVVNSGTSSAAVLNFVIPAGAAGTQGTPGEAATVSVGTTTTGQSGTQATVTNSGTSNAAVLNFTIPAGGLLSWTYTQGGPNIMLTLPNTGTYLVSGFAVVGFAMINQQASCTLVDTQNGFNGTPVEVTSGSNPSVRYSNLYDPTTLYPMGEVVTTAPGDQISISCQDLTSGSGGGGMVILRETLQAIQVQ